MGASRFWIGGGCGLAALLAVLLSGPALGQPVASDGSVLPFPPAPLASVAAPRLQEFDDDLAGRSRSACPRTRRTS